MPAPAATITTLAMGGTRSLCSVRTPMLTSPALSAWFSECGIGTKNDRIPRTSTTSPTTNKVFMKASVQPAWDASKVESRSEEHTSELQSRQYLVCRLLLEKK